MKFRKKGCYIKKTWWLKIITNFKIIKYKNKLTKKMNNSIIKLYKKKIKLMKIMKYKKKKKKKVKKILMKKNN
jgi:hypothetical protein